MRRLVLALAMTLGAGGCAGPLGLLLGGGPNLAANVQAGESNAQTLGVSHSTAQKITRPQARDIRQSADRNTVQAEQVQTVVVQDIPAWLILAFAVALFLDSPLRWPGQVRKAWRQRAP